MKPIHFNEISYFIGKRIKMILCRNINLTYISIYLNLQKTKVKAILTFKMHNTCKYINSKNKEYKYSHEFMINESLDNNNIIDNIIDTIIQDFETKNNLNYFYLNII
jgi:hypothetical protein